MNDQDAKFMAHALELAQKAEHHGEVPIGAVITLDDKIIAEGWNSPIGSSDPTAHAEIVAIRKAAQHLNNYRIIDTTLYVTLEPCPMCVGAMIQARISRLVFGAADPRAGCAGSVVNLLEESSFNHKISYTGGVLAEQTGQLLKDFFQKKRKSSSVG